MPPMNVPKRPKSDEKRLDCDPPPDSAPSGLLANRYFTRYPSTPLTWAGMRTHCAGISG